MRKIYITLLAVLITAISVSSMAQRGRRGKRNKKTVVAVMNFANYGNRSIKYLAKSIPESISSTLAEVKGIKVVERAQLGKIIDEIALRQSGIVDSDDIERAGKVSRADVLILGSISGRSSNIIVTIKAVNSTTGKLLSGKVVKGNSGNIFERANQSARAMGAVISGLGVGKISVSTTPSGCSVYIDGVLAGRSPVVEYKVIEGKHNIKVSKDGYIDYETTISVAAGKHKRLRPYLAEQKFLSRAETGIGAAYFFPMNSELKKSVYYYAFAGQSFDRLTLSLELGFTTMEYEEEVSLGLLGTATQERFYNLINLHGHLKYKLMPGAKYLQPYIGGIVGFTRLSDNRINPSGNYNDGWFKDNVENLKQYNLWALGITAGLVLMPYSRISIYADIRYYYHPQKVKRDLYGVPAGLQGDPEVIDTKEFHLNYFMIGGGAKYYFDF